jgi:Cu(I)/Ag(I) efflux system membrane fusion protein
MNRNRTILLLVVAIGFSFMAGSRYGRRLWSGDPAANTEPRILKYICPMHPQYTSDRPGTAPCCGMRLEPVYADGSGPSAGLGTGSLRLPPGTIHVDPAKRQLLGVRSVTVEKMAGHEVRRAPAQVVADETRIYRVNTGIDGWIQETYQNSTGSIVKKDQRLAAFYSPEFLAAQQAFLFGLEALARFQSNGRETEAQIRLSNTNIQQYADSLRNLGMSSAQIAEIGATRKITQNVYLTAPVTAFVLKRNVSPGQRVSRGEELYLLADLSRVWIVADLFEQEARFVRAGQTATVFYQDHAVQGRVSEVLPQFDPVSRTLKVRLDVDNPQFLFRPDMYVEVEFTFDRPSAVTVPVDAVVDSGLRKTVYVDHGDGTFEPRVVETGWQIGDRVEIKQGLEVGERIAVEGTFLLDSESRMKAAAEGVQAPAKDPICGMDVDRIKAKAAGLTSEYQGKTYYFCAEQCKKKLDKDPAKWVTAP